MIQCSILWGEDVMKCDSRRSDLRSEAPVKHWRSAQLLQILSSLFQLISFVTFHRERHRRGNISLFNFEFYCPALYQCSEMVNFFNSTWWHQAFYQFMTSLHLKICFVFKSLENFKIKMHFSVSYAEFNFSFSAADSTLTALKKKNLLTVPLYEVILCVFGNQKWPKH